VEIAMVDQAEKLREIMRQKGQDSREGGDKKSPSPLNLQSGGKGNTENSDSANNQENGNSGNDNNPKCRGKPRIITITSGKGGVGKTNVSVNMALAYARLGKKVVVMDADLGLANVNIMLNMVPRYTLYDMIRKRKTMKEIMVETDY